MILKRIADGIKNQDWFVVVVELLIVVVGIYIGLQVDDWNKEREAKEVTKTYYSRLIDDLETGKEASHLRITYFELTTTSSTRTTPQSCVLIPSANRLRIISWPPPDQQ